MYSRSRSALRYLADLANLIMIALIVSATTASVACAASSPLHERTIPIWVSPAR